MRFPSIKNLADSLINTIKRFPFECLFALAGTIAGTIYIQKDEYSLAYSVYTRVMMMANLGLLVSLAASLFTEGDDFKKRAVLRTIAALVAVTFFFIFGKYLSTIDILRFFLLSLAFHLLVSFAPFTEKGHIHGFWQFNKSLFLRFLASVLYSGVLYLGLAAAISACKLLFNIDVSSKVYGTLFSWIAGVFNTVFFLAGVPRNIKELEQDESYPKGLKVFTQYVLIPLASVYVIILLAYEAKILIRWSLPKGMVSNLILGYAVFGILSILLVYPLRDKEGNKWIKTYSRSFYFLLIPLIALLFLAIYSRILPYGITAPRYLLIALALWLLFITGYFLLSRKQNIKIIPVSLCIVTLLAIYGPQSAFSVAQYSQRKILNDIFEKYGAIKDGNLTSAKNVKMSQKDGLNAVEKLRYFVYDNDIKVLQPMISKNIAKVIDSLNKTKEIASESKKRYHDNYALLAAEYDWIVKYLGLNKFYYPEGDEAITGYAFVANDKDILKVKDYDYVIALGNRELYGPTGTQIESKSDGVRFKYSIDKDHRYTLAINGDSVSFDANEIGHGLINSEGKLAKYEGEKEYSVRNYILPPDLLMEVKQTAHYKITFKLGKVSLSSSGNGNMDVYQADGWFLISVLK